MRLRCVEMLTYSSDGRLPIEALYESYGELAASSGIMYSAIYRQELRLADGEKTKLPPIVSLRSATRGPALWVLAGIHGEEPAGPIAVARNTEVFVRLHEQGIPFVLFPLCNPKGYLLGWRYPDARRQQDDQGHSVGDCEHLLQHPEDPARPRSGRPACPEAGALADQVIALSDEYPPLLTLDLHEDEDEEAGPGAAYVYSQGSLGTQDPVAQEIVTILARNGFRIPEEGRTRFGEQIIDGIVPATQDGSIDELLASSTFVRDGHILRGPGARSALVVETPIVGVPLARRVAAHTEILASLGITSLLLRTVR